MLAAVVVVALFSRFFLGGWPPVAFLFLGSAAARSAHPWRVDHRVARSPDDFVAFLSDFVAPAPGQPRFPSRVIASRTSTS